jgi:hypothetical protein
MLSPLLVARGDQHWTTNGIHKGFVERSVQSCSTSGLDGSPTTGGRGYLGQYRLGYALWSLMGAPMHDFVFTWDWRDADLVVAEVHGRTVTTRDLAKYPELAKRFYALKPYAVTGETTTEFYDTAERRFGVATKTIQPDAIDRAGVPDPLHVAGSPDWADFFRDNSADNASREGLASRHKKLFTDAARVQLTQPKLTAIEWPDTMLRLIADEFVRREAAEKEAASKPKTKPSDGLNPLERAVQAERKLNPLELASQGIRTKPENPLEKSVRLEGEEQARQAAIRQEENHKAELARQSDRAEEAQRQAEAERQREFAADMARAERDAEERAVDAAYQRAARAQARDKRRYESQSPWANFQSDMNQRMREIGGSPGSAGGSAWDPAGARAPLPNPNDTGSGRSTSPFKPVDSNWHWATVKVTCSRCDGKGALTGAGTREVTCELCKGTGFVNALQAVDRDGQPLKSSGPGRVIGQ